MIRHGLLYLALFLISLPLCARQIPFEHPRSSNAEKIVAGLSRDNIGITASFDGSQILIYGAVKRHAPESGGGPLSVIVTLEGPLGPLTIRRKSRQFGIWVNTSSVGVAAAPSYYAIATSGPLNEILDPAVDMQQRISIPLAMRAFSGTVPVGDIKLFTEAMIRIREREGLYKLETGGVKLVENTLFRADFSLPANLTEGNYKARIFLLRGGRVIDKHQAGINVQKVGLERWLYTLAHQNAVLYGLLSLALAVCAGWAAAAVFRLIR